MNENFKSGFVAIIGRPNVGKSTLMNHLIGQKIAITSKKPQTTRNRIQTVYTCDDGQIVFLDTPGIHKAKNKLGEYMVQVAERTLKDVDVILWLVEPTTFIGAGERHIAEQLQGLHIPVILVINKVDTVDKDEILKARALACKGDAYAGLEKYKEAVGCYEKAAGVVDNMFAAAYLLKAGVACEELGDDAKALSFYKKIKDQYPQSMEGYDIDKYISRIENK